MLFRIYVDLKDGTSFSRSVYADNDKTLFVDDFTTLLENSEAKAVAIVRLASAEVADKFDGWLASDSIYYQDGAEVFARTKRNNGDMYIETNFYGA